MCQFIPQKLSRSKFKLPWIDISLKREMHKKDRLHKKAVHSKNNQHWKAFKHQCNIVSKLIREAHKLSLSYDVIGISLTDNPKKFWSYVRNSKSENLGIPPLRNSDSSVCVTDNEDKAESLNPYFHFIFTQEQMPVHYIGITRFPSISD